MRRRDVLKSAAAFSAAVSVPEALFSQQPARPADSAASGAGEDGTALTFTPGDEVGGPIRGFLTPDEANTLRRLADAIIPRTRTPGALDAGAPEFLDFYIGHSGVERQKVYREGLTRLNGEAQRRFQEPFAGLAAGNLDQLLAPLREPWTPGPYADPLVQFLRTAKDDLWRATVSSRAWAQAAEGRRRSIGGTYWYPVE